MGEGWVGRAHADLLSLVWSEVNLSPTLPFEPLNSGFRDMGQWH